MYDMLSDDYTGGQDPSSDPYIGADLTPSETKEKDGKTYYRINCATTIAMPKADRDYTLFGNYKAKFGARLFADPSSSAWTTLGE